jgi:hypothetical protein
VLEIAATAPEYGIADALSTLLTVESLLFAALSLGVSLSSGTPFGRVHLVSPATLASIAAALIVVIAAGALSAWIELFGGANWSWSPGPGLRATGLLVGILTQPVLAVLIAMGLRRS